MLHNIKAIVALVVLIVLAIAGWLWYGASNNEGQPGPAQSQQYVSAEAGLTTSATDTSDAALESDLNSISAQMNSLDTDTNSIDQSLKNQ